MVFGSLYEFACGSSVIAAAFFHRYFCRTCMGQKWVPLFKRAHYKSTGALLLQMVLAHRRLTPDFTFHFMFLVEA